MTSPAQQTKASQKQGSNGLIYIVEDDINLNETITETLELHGYTTQSFTDGKSFLDSAQLATPYTTPMCVVLDIDLPGLNGLEVQRVLKNKLPIVFMSGRASIHQVNSAWQQGASYFLLKPFAKIDLLSSVSKALKSFEAHASQLSALEKFALLTHREEQVIRLVGKKLLNKQISEQLGIAMRTVKLHRGNAMTKLECKHIADLMKILLEIDRG